jgi:hypothetical protein
MAATGEKSLRLELKSRGAKGLRLLTGVITKELFRRVPLLEKLVEFSLVQNDFFLSI